MLLQSSTHRLPGDLEDPSFSGPGLILLQPRSEDYSLAVCWLGRRWQWTWVWPCQGTAALSPAAFELGGARLCGEEPHQAD